MPDDEYYPLPRLIDDIVAAVKSENALPPDPVGQSGLAASVAAAANERTIPVGGTPALQQSISGRTYHLEENRFHLATISLRLAGDAPMWIPAVNTGKPGAASEFFPGPVGLDGRFRLAAPNRFGVAAARGRWVGASRFEIERRILGTSVTQHWLLTFDGDDVTVQFVDTDGNKVDIHGHSE